MADGTDAGGTGGNGSTIAEAQGNAQAILLVFEGVGAEENPLKKHLTREEEDRHFYFNDDILELAEEIEEIERRRIAEDAGLGRLIESRDALMQYPDEAIRVEQLNEQIEQRLVEDTGRLREIAALEEQILDEIDEVRTEYRKLAENLNDGREAYLQDLRALRAHEERRRSEAEDQRRVLEEAGADPEAIPLPGPDANAPQRVHTERYEATYRRYKLLEQGFAVYTTRETIEGLVYAALGAAAMEVATAGIAKFVRLGRTLDWAAGGIAASRAGRLGARLIGRFNALLPRTRERLMRLMRRREVDRPPQYPRNGEEIRGTPGRSAVSSVCRNARCLDW